MTLCWPEDMEAMQRGLARWVDGRLPRGWRSLFARQPGPQASNPYVYLTPISLPVLSGQGDGAMVRSPGEAITVETVASETTYEATLNGAVASYLSSAEATATEIVTGLHAAISALGLTGVTATDRAMFAGPVESVVYVEGLTSLDVGPGLGCKNVAPQYSDAVLTWSMDFVGPTREALPTGPLYPAAQAAGSMQLAFDGDPEGLAAAGWAFRGISSTRQPDAVVGSEWENRAGIDVRLGCTVVSYRLVDGLDPANIAVSAAFV